MLRDAYPYLHLNVLAHLKIVRLSDYRSRYLTVASSPELLLLASVFSCMLVSRDLRRSSLMASFSFVTRPPTCRTEIEFLEEKTSLGKLSNQSRPPHGWIDWCPERSDVISSPQVSSTSTHRNYVKSAFSSDNFLRGELLNHVESPLLSYTKENLFPNQRRRNPMPNRMEYLRRNTA